jgi:predicted nucleic acid-binding protein
MIVCLDTNTVVQALAEGHSYFTDCAVTAGADYVITDDQHFAALRNAGYKPQPITPGEFISKFVAGASSGSAR